MIRLNSEQMMALQDTAMHRFIDRVVDELPGYRGPLVEGRTRSTLFQAASMAVDQAQSFGLESERALFLYANLSVTLGGHFATDPALPWAGETLNDASYLGNEKMDDLWNAYMDYCEAVMGPEPGAYFPADAYRCFAELQEPPADTGTIVPVVADLAALWPEKARATPPNVLHTHILGAGKRAADLGFQDHGARVRFCRIAFLLGHAFDADPLHDWVGPVLQDGRYRDDAETMIRLEARFVEAVIAPALAWREGEDDGKDGDAEDGGD